MFWVVISKNEMGLASPQYVLQGCVPLAPAPFFSTISATTMHLSSAAIHISQTYLGSEIICQTL